MMVRARLKEYSSLHIKEGFIHFINSNDSIAKPAVKALSDIYAKDHCCGLLASQADILSLGISTSRARR